MAINSSSYVIQSAKARWPDAAVAVSVWHVRKRAEDILIKHELHSRKKLYWSALRDSTKTAAAWRRFVTLARTRRIPELERWIIETEAVLGPQLARHERFTSTGAIEAVLREVKKHLTLQRGSYKRVERLSLLLNLHTLKRNRLDASRPMSGSSRARSSADRAERGHCPRPRVHFVAVMTRTSCTRRSKDAQSHRQWW